MVISSRGSDRESSEVEPGGERVDVVMVVLHEERESRVPHGSSGFQVLSGLAKESRGGLCSE